MEKNKSKIIIVGEEHPLGVLDFITYRILFLKMLKQKGATDKEIEFLLVLLGGLLDNVKTVCETERDILERYPYHKILLEKMREGSSLFEMFLVMQARFTKLHPSEFGESFNQKVKEVLDAFKEYSKMHDTKDELEFRILAKAAGFFPKKLGSYLIFREASVSLKLVRAAKKITKEGGNVLVICGNSHAKKYARLLSGLGYRVEYVPLPLFFKFAKTFELLDKILANLQKKCKITPREFEAVAAKFLASIK